MGILVMGIAEQETRPEAQPCIGRFWFIGRENRKGPPDPSILVMYAEPVAPTPPGATHDPVPVEDRRYAGPHLCADEVWPRVSARYPWVGFLDETYFPGGSVHWCAENKSALLLIDPKLNERAFLTVVAKRFNISLATAIVGESAGQQARACIGWPDANAPAEPDLFCATAPSPITPALASAPLRQTFQRKASAERSGDRAQGALLGLAIGDALGSTLEFAERDTRPVVSDLIGGGPYSLRPGEWTDDTSMALCLADSLIACGDLDTNDVMRRFVRWYRQGENSVAGRCFDIGRTISAALERFEQTGKTAASGPHDSRQAGNATLARLAPVAIFAAPDPGRAAALAERQSQATHPARVVHDACRFFATLLAEAINGSDKGSVLAPRFWLGKLAPLAAGEWKVKGREEIESSSYVVATLEAAVWCVERTLSFEDALILAVNLGGDADTVGAVTGQLAGALYGRQGIPQRWLDRLAWRENIEARAIKLIRSTVYSADYP